LAVVLGLCCATAFVGVASGGSDDDARNGGGGDRLRALVYHETTGFRHPSIP
jgi:hypothetical protein